MIFLKKYLIYFVTCFCLITSAGCNEQTEVTNVEPIVDSFSTSKQEMKVESNASKYDQAVSTTSTIDSAIELSQKYALLSEQHSKLKEENLKIKDENEKQKQQIASMQTKLDQTKKELSEANDLLVEMRIELNNWKTDILGFRDEMRDAQKAQLEALFKILTILGAQSNAAPIQQATQPTPPTPAQEPVQPTQPQLPVEDNNEPIKTQDSNSAQQTPEITESSTDNQN